MGQLDKMAGRSFWLSWLAANSVVWIIGFGLAQGFARILFAQDSWIQMALEKADYIWIAPQDSLVGAAAYGLIAGAVIGFSQSLVLGQRLSQETGRWGLATTGSIVETS